MVELAQNGIIEEVKQDKIAVKEIELLISVMIAEIEKKSCPFILNTLLMKALTSKRQKES